MRHLRRRLRMLSVAGVSAALVGVISAAAATAPVPTTAAASDVTSTAATLNGVIAPSGSQVAYEFQYGTTASYTSATVPLVLPTSSTPENVSTRIGGLKPGTTYHYRLAISTSARGNATYYPVSYAGRDATFTTLATGKLALESASLPVRDGRASVSLGCAGTAACRGTLTLARTIGTGSQRTPVRLGSARFVVGAGRRATVEIALSGMTVSDLQAARRHAERATLSATTSTHQRGFRRTVTLTG